MAIRIARNDAGNCINFFGSSNPTYWNACLVGEINEDNDNNVNVINSVRSEESGATVYEFFNLPYTSFVDRDSNAFENASECAEYITEVANVLSNTGTFIFSQDDTIDAQREDTNTTVLFSNGDIYAVNSLHAAAAEDGTITISTIRGDKDIYTKLRHYNTTVNAGAVTGFNTVAAAVDRLNEVLGGGTITVDLGNAASEESTESTAATFTVYGDRITATGTGVTLGYTSTADAGNFDTSNGLYSNQVISEAGEYYEFSQNGGDWSNTTGLTFGLFDETTYHVDDLDEDLAGNAVKAVLRLRLRNTPFTFIDPASTLGRLNEEGFSSTVNTVEQWRVGLDSSNRPYISAYISGAWTVVCRTETPAATGTEFRFVAIMPLANELEGIRNMTVNTLVEAPALTWYYIESPDGDFYYPLFSSTEEANYVDEAYGTAANDAGDSHAHVFADESPSQNIWYMPDTYMFHAQSSAPAAMAGVAWNEIATGADANYIPTQYADNTVTVDEGASINLAIKPAGDAATYNVTGIPTGLAFNGEFLIGTAPEVTSDNVTNPSDTHTITVTKANSFGSSVGTLTLVVTNTTAPSTALSGFTWDNTSTPLVNSTTMGEGSVVAFDDTLQEGKRLIIDKAWVEANILPNLVNIDDKVIIGVPTSTADWSSVAVADFEISISWVRISSTIIENYLTVLGGSNNGIGIGSLTNALYDFGFEVDNGTTYAIACATSDMNTEPSPSDGGSFTRIVNKASFAGPHTIVIATISAETDLSTSGIGEIDAPVASSILTDWTKALDFSGSNEHAKPTSSWLQSSPLQMAGLANLVDLGTVSQGDTSNNTSARPWATAVVFNPDGNNSNQMIWNQGEGASSGNDNIYLRLSAAGSLFFGWGREGSGYNECRLANQTISSSNWYGVAIAHNGVRLGGGSASAANLADCFTIYMMSSADSFAAVGSNLSVTANWTSSGNRMDRTVAGDFTIGGRGTNNNFHGKIASTVVTTLLQGGYNSAQFPEGTMVGANQAKAMITDPVKWLDDYKVRLATNNPSGLYRQSSSRFASNYFTFSNAYQHTYVWLMGDGTSDSYANGIRNYIYPADQNYAKLQLNNMQSNDIQTVSISGLS
jgi:hypothetical protein